MASFAFYFVGGLWFSNLAFGKHWIKYLSQSNSESNLESQLSRMMSFRMIQCLAWSSLLYGLIHFMNLTSIRSAVFLALGLWLGISSVEGIRQTLFESKPKQLVIIEQLYWALGSVLTAIVLIHWR